MKNSKKTICFINGSLRGSKSSSLKFINYLSGLIQNSELEKVVIPVKPRLVDRYPDLTLQEIGNADIIVIVFPLYSYCLPGGLVKLLEEFHEYSQKNKINSVAKVYAIVNCAYVDPIINNEEIRVIENFCTRLQLDWRFAIAVGCGPVTLITKSVDYKLYRALKSIKKDMEVNTIEKNNTIYVKPMIPRIIMDTIRTQLDRNALKVK